jgi:hypothetical protein
LDILKNEYGFLPDTQPSDITSVSTQVDLSNQIEKIDVSTQTDQINLALVPYSKVRKKRRQTNKLSY